MVFSTKLRIGILIVIGLPSICGFGLVAANLLNQASLVGDYREVQPIVINKSSYNLASQDPFEFESVLLDQDLLIMEISHHGGVKDHTFVLIGSGDFMESAPIQTTIVLSHDANGDSGEALVTKKLIFDLKPLKTAFLNVYSFFAPSGNLLIHLENYGEVLTYSFE